MTVQAERQCDNTGFVDAYYFQVKAGLGMNVIGVLSVLLAVSTWGRPIFSLDTYPDWAPTYGVANTTGF